VGFRDDDVQDRPVDLAFDRLHHFPACLVLDPVQVQLIFDDRHPVLVDVVAFLYLDAEVKAGALDERQRRLRGRLRDIGFGCPRGLGHGGRGRAGLYLRLGDRCGDHHAGRQGGRLADLRGADYHRAGRIRQQDAGGQEDGDKRRQAERKGQRAPDQGEGAHLAAALAFRLNRRDFHRHR